MQNTLKSPVAFAGIGLHLGRPVRLRILPAPANSGIVFYRSDIGGASAMIPARWEYVTNCKLNTGIENGAGVTVSTIEHLMAALAGTGIHNARIEIDGPEVPVLDGSAAGFVRGILRAGIQQQAAPLHVIEVLETVEVSHGQAWARLEPGPGLVISFAIDFADEAIGQQAKVLDMANGAFIRELCDSRTFCRQADVTAMHEQGLALGGSLLNAVVVEKNKVLSPGGLRHPDEAVRHKMLDALGDLYTAGAPLQGRYTGERAGHALSNELLRALFARPSAWRSVRCTAAMAAQLPGSGVVQADLGQVA